MTEFRITMTHVALAGYCPRGVRMWCAEKGIDLLALTKAGVPLSEFEAIGDAHSKRVIDVAKREAARGQE